MTVDLLIGLCNHQSTIINQQSSNMREIILGLVQGLTEFLPISSSGHLAIGQQIISGSENIDQDILLNILLHFATLLVVLIYYRKDIATIVKVTLSYICSFRSQHSHNSVENEKKNARENPLARKMLPLIVVGSIPTGILGVVLKFSNRIEDMFSSLSLIGVSLLVTGTLLYLSDKFSPSHVKKDISYVDALIIGTIQGIAILPGISRSGSTISIGILRGIERRTAATFSFLLSIPAILGAVALEAKDISTLADTPQFIPYLLGMLVAFGSGYIAIAALIRVVMKRKLSWFSVYCWAIGGMTLIYCLIED
jgi:undecaprenyl-diphosphatase